MSTQVYQNLLASLKKANKIAKQKMAEKNGFKTVGDYTAFLNEKLRPVEATIAPAKKVTGKKAGPKVSTPKEKPVIHNVHILDESGSMGGTKYTNAVKGINEEVEALKKDTTVIYTQTLVGFSNPKSDVIYNFKTPILEVKAFNGRVKGMTALNDCIGSVLTRLLKEVKPNEKHIVTIFTDGEENASKSYTNKMISDLIEDAQNKGFTITFMGTKSDTEKVIKNLNIDLTNTLVHDNTSEGIADSFQIRTNSLNFYSTKVKARKEVKLGFFKEVGKL